jgi:hypothetical protein
MGRQPLSFLLLVLLAAAVCAQTTFDPLTVAVGARALGMGRACAAAADDGDALFCNPAALGEMDTFKFSSMSGNLLEDVHYLALAGVYPLGQRAAVGFGYAGAFVPGIDLRSAGKTFLGQANFGDSVALASYGRKLSDDTSLGLSLKYYMISGSEINSGNGQGWNLDAGLMQKGNNWLSLALVGQNILSTNNISYQNGETEPLPSQVKAGAALHLLGNSFNAAFSSPVEATMLVDLAFDLKRAGSLLPQAGLEISPNQSFSIRAGVDRSQPTAGITLRYAGLGFHYAYHSFGDFNDNSGHFFSLTFDERGWPAEGPNDSNLACR